MTTHPDVLDLTLTDYAFSPEDGGRHGHIACWEGRQPCTGDYLILRNGISTTRYQVTKVDPCRGVFPPTMWMADLDFAPRQTPAHLPGQP